MNKLSKNEPVRHHICCILYITRTSIWFQKHTFLDLVLDQSRGRLSQGRLTLRDRNVLEHLDFHLFPPLCSNNLGCGQHRLLQVTVVGVQPGLIDNVQSLAHWMATNG